MTSGSVSKRYARALFELSRDGGDLEAAGSALGELAQAVASIDEEALAPGVLTHEDRRKLGQALAEGVGRESTVGRFVRLVAERDRITLLPAMHAWFVRLEDAAAGRARMQVRSAAPLEQRDLAEVVEAFARLAGCEVIPEPELDGDLIGGLVVEIGGRVYDGSVRTRLGRLGQRMAGA